MISNPSLDFVAAPALKPAEVEIDPELMAQYQQELKNVRLEFSINCFSITDLVYRPSKSRFPKKMMTCSFVPSHHACSLALLAASQSVVIHLLTVYSPPTNITRPLCHPLDSSCGHATLVSVCSLRFLDSENFRGRPGPMNLSAWA